MVLNTVMAVLGGLLLLYYVARMVRLVTVSGIVTLVAQSIVNVIFATVIFTLGFISLPIAAVIALMPIGARFVAYGWFYWQGKKVLGGGYGEEAMWAAELAESGDTEFMKATARLPQRELREIGIISDTKDELRENTLDRLDELTE